MRALLLAFGVVLCIFASYVRVNGELYFASLSNYGCSGNQKRMASALKAQAEKTPFSLMVSPGDNFPGGIDFKNCFESVYSEKSLQVPLFVSMGQADWDNGNAHALLTRNNVTYDSNSDIFPRFSFPNYFYHYVAHYTDTSNILSRRDGTVLFVFIDTFILSSSFPDHKVSEQAFQNLNATLHYGNKHHDFTIVVGNKYLASSYSIDSSLKKVQQLIVDTNVELVISGNSRGTYNSTIEKTTFLNCDSYCLFKVDGNKMIPYTIHHGEQMELSPITTQLPSPLSLQGIAGDELPALEVVELSFKKGAKHLSRDAFLKIVGTVGLMILAACMGSLIVNRK
ncbi:putative conserved acid phosphatase [Cryptosporidium canis]|uniref:Conserved acid phosphatase n=1 Tax=Cryptosporidium canis TaxID=195482 RepID=A0ABQ8P560_9CRYT|nr:putative conserved acid phosphatase [Cryptosporidium canis]KAJ1609347.1 putative conserved acid phosphatase [Cryptosporidium canis]